MIPVPPAASLAQPGAHQAPVSLAGELHHEFPAWQIDIGPGGLPVWAASWRSQDGRHQRYIVAGSGSELLARLRIIGQP